MKIKEAVERISWRYQTALEQRKPFIPNKKDIDSINSVIDLYDKELSKVKFSKLLVKMYLIIRTQSIKKHKAHPMCDFAQKHVSKELTREINVLFKEFVDECNFNECHAYAKDNDLDIDNFRLMNEKQRKIELAKALKLVSRDGIKRLLGDVWKIEDLEDAIYLEINQLISMQ